MSALRGCILHRLWSLVVFAWVVRWAMLVGGRLQGCLHRDLHRWHVRLLGGRRGHSGGRAAALRSGFRGIVVRLRRPGLHG